jgi:putative ATP-dependent endonuclease of OLD family
MRLNRITVHNYRGIREESFLVHGYTLLVGANNSGKSTIVDALRAFYEKDGFKYRHDRDWPMIVTQDEESWVELDFRCTAAEYGTLKDDYKIGDERLVVRKYFRTDKKGSGNKSKSGCIFAMARNREFSDDQFYGAKNVQQGKLGEIIYIPAVSRVDEHTKLSGPSALRDLLMDILEDVVESSPAYDQLRDGFLQFAGSIKSEETADGRSLEHFEAEFSELLSTWQTSFQIAIDSPRPADIIKNLMRYECVDQSLQKPQCADDFGSGFQRHFIFSLIHIAPKYVSAREPKKEKDFTPTFRLILFEEPEAFLHPPQQEILADSLRALTTGAERQVICSTHSSHFVSKNTDYVPAIVRLQRTDGAVSVAQIAQKDWEDIVDANQAINRLPSLRKKVDDDDLHPEMEALKYFLWLNADRSTLFFANHVLLVEGTADQVLVNRLLKDGKIGKKLPGVYVLDCLGKYNIHRFMALLARLGIVHSVLHDEDEPGAESEEINDLIQRTKCDGLTYRIAVVPKNLETLLGVPSCKPHRKPQHVMHYYHTGQIGKEQLEQFCDLVAECIPDTVLPLRGYAD